MMHSPQPKVCLSSDANADYRRWDCPGANAKPAGGAAISKQLAQTVSELSCRWQLPLPDRRHGWVATQWGEADNGFEQD
ncbi:hypothetical protein GCM10009856_52310 [Mycolicibacterium llatzerense]